MGRMGGIKWDRAVLCRPNNNIISSDFPKYYPQPWKFMDGQPRIEWVLSYEYQRMWLEEREQWKKRMYPENEDVNVDVVKKYVTSLKNVQAKPKEEKKKPFRMKKFQNIRGTINNRRPSNDKAMAYLKTYLKDQKPSSKQPEQKAE